MRFGMKHSVQFSSLMYVSGLEFITPISIMSVFNSSKSGSVLSQSAFTCSKFTIETLEQDVKHVQS